MPCLLLSMLATFVDKVPLIPSLFQNIGLITDLLQSCREGATLSGRLCAGKVNAAAGSLADKSSKVKAAVGV